MRLVPGRSRGRRDPDQFWAVHDVSFEVGPGESYGIIGPNGAGKSTLLKLLAGIMRPTLGEIQVNGRVSALIELGAGFHGDLSGRENIYLNASILGMTRREARKKFDEIVDFAGIGEFLDMPVKRYSSGMHARLGFAVAAHVCPQVLLVDEVLSVGDRVFRAKCMETMRAFLSQGVAIVFVSHDLGAVGRFCERAMVIERGKEVYQGPVTGAIGHYYQACSASTRVGHRLGVQPVRILRACVRGMDGRETTTVAPGEEVRFEFEACSEIDIPNPSFGMSILRADDHLTAFETSSTRLGLSAAPIARGDRRTIVYDFKMNLLPGEYAIGLHIRDRDDLQYAAEEPYVVRLLVDGPADCGGIVHLAPRVEIAAPRRAEAPACPASTT